MGESKAWWYLGPENTFHIIDGKDAWFCVDTKHGKWLRSGIVPLKDLILQLGYDCGELE